jgi:hypothetical protein
MNETQAPKDAETSRYQITDMEGVRWYLKKLLEKDSAMAAIKAEAEQVAANYAAMVELIETDKRGLEFLYAAQVREVAKAEAEKGKRKSVTTPYGVLSFREQPARLELADRGTAADVAVTLGMTTTAADLTAYRKHAEAHFEATGEPLPGFEFKPSEEKFSIRQSKAKETTGEAPESA